MEEIPLFFVYAKLRRGSIVIIFLDENPDKKNITAIGFTVHAVITL